MQKIYLTQKLVETELLEQEGFTSFSLNKDSGVLIYGVTETVKDEIKKPRRQISCSFASIFSRFFSATSNSFSSKRYKWKRG